MTKTRRLYKSLPFALLFAAYIFVQLTMPFMGLFTESAQAYKCRPEHYFDQETQTCKTYKSLTPTVNADGSTNCPEGTHHEGTDGVCWGLGGEKQNYAPTLDNGQPIEQSQVTCGLWHDVGNGDKQTFYYADRHSCCSRLSWPLDDTINPTACVDPDIPEQDPTATPDPNDPNDPNAEKECTDGSTPNPDTGLCADGSKPGEAKGPTTDEIPQVETRCGEARVNLLVCGEEGGNTALNNILRIVVMVLTVGVGVAAVGGLAWASVLYAKAEDNEGNVSSAKELIRNIVIGLLLYVFLVAITNWLVPGGVIG